MSQNHPESSAPARRKSVIELNGTFLVRPRRVWITRASPKRPPASIEYQSGPPVPRSPGGRDDAGRPASTFDGGRSLPFHFLRTGDRMGRAVVKIQRGDGATGTGFLVAPDVLLTNHHVLPTPEIAAGSVALANYEILPANDPAGRAAVTPLDPSLLFVTNADLDFTFCGVRGLDFLGAIPLDRERAAIGVGETVTLIQHPRGRPKEIAMRDNHVVRADGVVLHYSCDTEPGSSGSPVFNNQWRPVAIHHASIAAEGAAGRELTTRSRDRYLKEGVRLSAIALWLETAEAGSREARDQVARLRGLFGGLNPRAGFFGALGRRARGRHAAEVVAEAYRTRSEAIDLGYWDTRPMAIAPGGLRDRSADVGRAVAEMGLDLWCFSDVDPAFLDLLCLHLWAAHGLSYLAISIQEPGAAADGLTAGMLVRRSRAFEAEPIAGEAGVIPPRLRLLVKLRGGDEAEFLVAPLSRGPAAGSVQAARAAAGRGDGDAAWIFLGDARAIREVEAGAVVAAASPRSGAVAIVGGGSRIAQVFVSPNLGAVHDPSHLVSVVRDRALPEGLRRLDGPPPIAVRISLDAPEALAEPHDDLAPDREPRPPDGPLDDPDAPPAAAVAPAADPALDLLIEAKIRDLLGPLVAKILGESRGKGDGPTPEN